MKKYDLLLKNGHVIDPDNNINSKLDVAVSNQKIASVEKNLSPDDSSKVLDVEGMIITPGLVDLHAHCFGYFGSIFPDEMCLPFGTTTMLDAGGSGWKTFDEFNNSIILKSTTKVFSLLNIVGGGMIEDKEQLVADMDPVSTASKINERKDVIVGVKVAHFEASTWEAVDRGRKAAELSNTFMMVDQNPIKGRTMEGLLGNHMVSGDVLTHLYAWGKPILDKTGNVNKCFHKGREDGILFDLGHGAGSFSFSMAIPSVKQGFVPDTISTDHHRNSMLTNHANMPECMSKMLAIGMNIEDVVRKSTIEPAKIIGHPELGNLSEGSEADIAILEKTEGDFGLIDNGLTGNRVLNVKEKLENRITVKSGQVVWDKNGIGMDSWENTPKPDLKNIYHN